MDFSLSKEHELLCDLYREFAENEVKPFAEELDEEEKFPVETVKKLSRYGFMGIPFPKEYGGAGGDMLAYALAIEELSKVCASTGVIVSAHTSLCCDPIYAYGTEEQKRKYLPDLLSGKKLGAFALTEPEAGTDAGNQHTHAVLDGDNYILNGSKIFITNAGYADVFVIMAMTNKAERTRGISAFIVERGFEGFSVGKEEKKMGIHGSSTCELIMENCIVPKENMLGREGKGYSIAMKTLDTGRIGIAAQALGIAEGAIAEAVKYVKERKQFGKKIAQYQYTQFQLADMVAQANAAKLLVYAAANKKDRGEAFSVEAATAKLFAAQAANDITRKALQLFGGYGYTREYPIERMMRDAKITEIYEGTNEVQRMVIAASLKLN